MVLVPPTLVRLLPVLLAAALVATIGPTPSPVRAEAPQPAAVAPDTRQRPDLLARIKGLDIVDKVVEVPDTAPAPGARFFRIWFRLPVDHDHPNGRTFRLRGSLIHRGTDRPTVLATSGYDNYKWDYPSLNEVAYIVRGNQLDLEHRFFEPSRPSHPDWAKQLTIRQSAADQHLVVRALKRIYRRPWLSTGASKGGMTMTYFRRFYPRDVAGTIAYVAPNDAVDSEDVYGEFQANVGGAEYADCRAALVAVQRRILEDRAWFEGELADLVDSRGARLTLVGGVARAVEIVAIELYFAFWQYQSAENACNLVPEASATRAELWSWVDRVFGWYYVTDEDTGPYVPYYYQAATQLGAPMAYEDELADLLLYPGHDVAATFVPDRLEPLTFDASAMADVDAWVRTSSTRMLFVYGELDPWSAERFECGTDGAERQCYQRTVPGGNHGSAIILLPDGARRAAIARVRQWAGLSGTDAAITAAELRAQRVDEAREQPGRVLGG